MIFYHNEEQKRLAVESKDLEEAKRGSKVYTEILPAPEFYLAEEYHQKYWLQQVPELVTEFHAVYPDISDFINSTAVARINGYVGGYGMPEALREELDSFGLSPAGSKALVDIVTSFHGYQTDNELCPLGNIPYQ